jgi:hypothetical protein
METGMWIKRKSVISGIERTRNIPVNPDDYLSWQAGVGDIETLMPYLTDSDREFILSGITSDEWDAAFAELDEDEGVL